MTSAGSPLPTGTVTFLFTDLEGSTRLWEEHPDAMRAALARHDEILRNAVEKREGVVVKTTGDGLHAAFAIAPDALTAAVDAQRTLVTQDWLLPEPLKVRMGVHTGAAELRDGDYYGPAVNRAARLAAAAHGGQIVASASTADLARDDLGTEVDLADLGEHRLRDLARPERVYQVMHPELRTQFPELRSLATVPGNLPIHLTSFVGRDDEIAQIAEMVDRSSLVTLIGVGGVGKTRLAVQVAGDVALHFSDGAWFADFAPAADPNDVALSVARSMGVEPRPGAPAEEKLLDFLRDKHLLIVFDNCEHLVDAAGRLASTIVQSCPNVHVVATSRESLAVAGEQLFPVRPLVVEDSIEVARQSAPVQLFVDRAAAVRPGFQLDDGNVAAVIDICRRLDGIPLAIELAAARARSLAPAEIAERLDRRFSLLSGGRRGALARHETLRAAVDWSYELLDESERATLARVAVFLGGYTLEAAEAVAADGDAVADPVIDVLMRLVDKSLVSVDDDAGTTRYRLLETIRQYALEQLDATGETEETRGRHLQYFVEFAERAGPGLLTADELVWDARTRPEIDNVLGAVAWAAEVADVDAALRLTTAFEYQRHYRHAWGLGAYDEALLGIPGARSHPLYALGLGTVARVVFTGGDYDRAVSLANEALAIATDAGDDHGQWVAEQVLGAVALWDARDDPAEHYERGLEAARRSGGAADIAFFQGLLGTSLPSRGHEWLPQALIEAEQAVALAESTGSASLLSHAHFGMGYVLSLHGDPSAVDWLKKSLEASSGFNRSGALSILAVHQAMHGTAADAIEATDDALQDAVQQGDRTNISTSLDLAAGVLGILGEAEVAAELIGAIERGALPKVVRAGVPGKRRERRIQMMREAMGDEAFEAAIDRGARMSFEAVVARAVDRIETLRAGSATLGGGSGI